MQGFESVVRFICPKCGKLARDTVAIPEPDWAGAEGMSDLSSDDQVEVACSECEEVFAAYAFSSAGGCQVSLDDYPDVRVQAEMAFFSPPEGDEWLDQEPITDPHIVFMDSHRQTGEMLTEHGSQDGAHLLNRMIFAQQVSALEAYLSDTLVRGIDANPDALKRLLAQDKELHASKFSLADLAYDQDLLQNRTRAYLRSLLYHNLKKVDALYSAAFDVRILDQNEVNARLFEAIKYRHDCVHRNGMDADGNRLTVFTKDYVQGVADLFRSLVDRLEVGVWGEPAF